jgi:hypothetical protein
MFVRVLRKGKHCLKVSLAFRKGKTYSEQILEPSQVYEFHSIFKVRVKNMMIILIYTEVVCMSGFR